MRHPRIRLISVVAYLTVMTLWIYGVLDRTTSDWLALLLPVMAVFQLAVGFALGRWGALILPLLVIPISIPAGNPPIAPDEAEPFPIWFTAGFYALFEIPLVAVGVAARKLYDRARGRVA